MKRLMIKFEMRLFGRCYCAVPRPGHNPMYHLRDLGGISYPVPTKSWAQRIAGRRARRTGDPWGVTRWSRE